MHPADQKHPVSERLRQLPPVRAPHTLLPRVMAAVRAWADRTWHERAWFTSPLQGQLAAIAVLVLVVAGVVMVWPDVEARVDSAVAPLRSAITADVTDTAQRPLDDATAEQLRAKLIAALNRST